MASDEIKLKLSADSAHLVRELAKAKASVQSTGKGMESAMNTARLSFDNSVKSLISFRTIAGLVGGLSVAGIVKMADDYTLLDNKLKLVTKSEADLKSVQDGLYQQALRSHSSYAASVDLYSRFARATQSLGVDQANLLRITETLNKAMVVSGATQDEAKSAIIQLSQGMASGVLRGEEFNSIMENGSRIAKMLADYLHTDVGGLRKMAMEGKITSEIMVQAFAASAETIDQEFGKMQPTISQAMTDLQTVFGRLVSDSNKSADGTNSVAQEIKKLAETIDTNRTGIIELFTTIISMSSKAVKAVANIGQSLQGWAAVKRGQLGFFEYATMNAEDLAEWLKKNNNEAALLQSKIDKVREKLNINESKPLRYKYDIEEAKRLRSELDELLETQMALNQAQGKETSKDLPPLKTKPRTKELSTEEKQRIKQGETAIMQLEREKEAVGDLTREEKMRWETTSGQYKDLSEAHKKKLAELSRELDKLDELGKFEKEQEAMTKAINKQNESLASQAETFGMTTTQATLYKMQLEGATSEQLAFAKAMLESVDAQKQVKELYEASRTPEEKHAETLKKLNELLEAGTIDMDLYGRSVAKAAEELEKTKEKGKSEFEELKQAIDGWGKDSAKAIVDFCRTGEKSFGDMIDSMIDDLLQMMVYENLTKPVFGMISGGIGGMGGSSSGGVYGWLESLNMGSWFGMNARGNAFNRGTVIPFANGGVVNRPTLFPMAQGMGIMGEAGPEAVMPLKRGIDGKLGVQGGGSLSIHVPVSLGDASKKQASELKREIERTCKRVTKRWI